MVCFIPQIEHVFSLFDPIDIVHWEALTYGSVRFDALPINISAELNHMVDIAKRTAQGTMTLLADTHQFRNVCFYNIQF